MPCSSHAQTLLRQQSGEVLAKFQSCSLGIRTASNGDPWATACILAFA